MTETICTLPLGIGGAMGTGPEFFSREYSRCKEGDATDFIYNVNIPVFVQGCGSIYAARICFNGMLAKDIVTWTTVIEGFRNPWKGFGSIGNLPSDGGGWNRAKLCYLSKDVNSSVL
ncbi:Uncharacterized protein Fot_03595 [Forsythia ovata]|uniref:Uncharacterized protein n=1 Tax=Forsythia ovata TaxID=205694 RepID=A0ABD1XA59_9LAMI